MQNWWQSAAPCLNVILVLHWPCQLDRMLINCHRAISSHLGIRAFAGQQNMCLIRLRDVRTCLANRLEKIDILVTNSFICRANPISLDIFGNHPFHSVQDSEETLESWSRICEHYDGYDTQHWHSENGLFFGFSQGWNWTNQIYCI